MATTYCSVSLVVLLDIHRVKTTVAIVQGQHALRTNSTVFMSHSSHLGQVLLREQMSSPVLFLNLDDAHVPGEESQFLHGAWIVPGLCMWLWYVLQRKN